MRKSKQCWRSVEHWRTNSKLRPLTSICLGRREPRPLKWYLSMRMKIEISLKFTRPTRQCSTFKDRPNFCLQTLTLNYTARTRKSTGTWRHTTWLASRTIATRIARSKVSLASGFRLSTRPQNPSGNFTSKGLWGRSTLLAARCTNTRTGKSRTSRCSVSSKSYSRFCALTSQSTVPCTLTSSSQWSCCRSTGWTRSYTTINFLTISWLHAGLSCTLLNRLSTKCMSTRWLGSMNNSPTIKHCLTSQS